MCDSVSIVEIVPLGGCGIDLAATFREKYF